MSTLQVTTITTVNNTTPLILQTGNTGGGQIVLNSANSDVQFVGNVRVASGFTGDGSGLTLPTANVANAAFGVANGAFGKANAALANTNGVWTAGNFNITGVGSFGYYDSVPTLSTESGFLGSDKDFRVKTTGGNAYHLVVKATTGYVGINTASPQGLLDVYGLGGYASTNHNVRMISRFKADATVSNMATLFDTNATASNTSIRGFYHGYQSQIFTIARYDSNFTAGVTHDLYIDSSGNVGIGRVPGAPLDVGNVITANTPTSILARPPSGGDGTFNLAASTGSGTTVNSEFCRFGIKYGTANTNHNAGIGFWRGSDVTGGFMTFHTNDWSERMRIDNTGNIGIGVTTPVAYNSSDKVLAIAGTGQTNPATIIQMGHKDYPGRGYSADETFFISGIYGGTEITRITASSLNGVGLYFKVKVVGHSASTGSGLNIKEYYFDGSSVTQISTTTAGSVPPLSVTVPSSGVIVISVASANGGVGSLNGVMRVEWMAPVDFSSANWTIS